MKIKKITSFILVSLMLLSSAAGCSEKAEGETAPADSGTSAQTDETSPEEDGSAAHYYNDQEAVDYEGWEMRIATSGSEWTNGFFNNILVSDLTGDVFNDAIFNRMTAVQDKYNIKMVEEYGLEVTNVITKSVSANTGDYAMGYQVFTDEINGFVNNIYIGASDMPVFDFSKPWWDQGAIEDLAINGKIYYIFCDTGFGHYESNLCLYYNGVVLENNQLESPYNLYKEGKWTMDQMHSMMQTASNDENGDGKMKAEDDIFGFVGRVGHYMPMLAASDTDIVHYDDSTQTIEFDVTSDIIMAIGDKTGEMLLDKSIALPEHSDSRTMFKSGKSLFYCHLLGDFRNLRDQEDDYGIINWPSIYENITGKMYTINPESIFIPSDCPDPERLATIIEAMNAYTYEYVLDEYVEKTVIGKGARDRQSAEVIREHFYQRAYDLADAFGLSSPQSAWEMALSKGIYASVQQRSSKTVQREMGSILSELD